MSGILRRFWPYAVAVGCCGFALATFDWHAVIAIIGGVNWRLLLVTGVPLVFAIFILRALRWMAVTGLPVRAATLVDIYLYVAVAIAVATPTPMQLGEALKIKFARRAGLSVGTSAIGLVLERIVDLAVLFAIAAVGLLWRQQRHLLAILAVVAAAGAVPLIPQIARITTRLLKRTGISRRLGVSDGNALPYQRYVLLVACTVLNWLVIVVLWQVAVASVAVTISFVESLCLVPVVAILSALSMVPGGIGVAEISTRAVLISFGVPAAPAEAAAIAIRLLTPMLIGLGLGHLPFLMALRSKAHFATEPDGVRVRSSSR